MMRALRAVGLERTGRADEAVQVCAFGGLCVLSRVA
jgi:hypothetical protein